MDGGEIVNKIFADGGKCELKWDNSAELIDLVETMTDVVCAAVEELASRNPKGKSAGQAIKEREALYQVLVDRVRYNRVMGTIGVDYAENDD